VSNPEIGKTIAVNGVETNYHDIGSGAPVVLVHGSGPGVTAWANWRLNIPVLAEKFRVIAPDMLGFGYTQAPEATSYAMDAWVDHLIGLMDALGIEKFHMLGNSFGGALALAIAIRFPVRLRRMVLMGAVGLSFPLTKGLDAVWGYEPSVESMRALLDIFAYDRSLVSDELAELRYKASIRPGVQEAFGAMFPAPRQRWVEAMALPEVDIAAIEAPTLIIHGREDQVIPPANSLRLFNLIDHAELHIFGRCGHWSQIEHRHSFNKLVSCFFSGD
jgi:2-hydroxymuconate-semialdehyde hydrolase